MSEIEDISDQGLFKEKVGQRLREAREHAGLDLADVASRTRIPLRHLTAIEASDHSGIPSPTYSIGFVKNYARMLGLDDGEFGNDIRAELGYETPGELRASTAYEPVDPIRIAPKWLAWSAAALAVLLFGGYLVWRHNEMSDATPPAPLSDAATGATDNAPLATPAPINMAMNTGAALANNSADAGQANANSAAPASTSANGNVVLTATKVVWVRIYDAKDKILFEKEMNPGESYTVPATADHPQIRTGDASLLNVTVDGKAVPALGPAQHTIKDVGVTAAELLARPAASPTASSSH